MTKSQFIAKFREARDTLQVKTVVAKSSDQVRFLTECYGYCPITLVYKHETGKDSSNIVAYGTAVKLGLDMATARQIIYSSDAYSFHSCYDPELRKVFLEKQ